MTQSRWINVDDRLFSELTAARTFDIVMLIISRKPPSFEIRDTAWPFYRRFGKHHDVRLSFTGMIVGIETSTYHYDTVSQSCIHCCFSPVLGRNWNGKVTRKVLCNKYNEISSEIYQTNKSREYTFANHKNLLSKCSLQTRRLNLLVQRRVWMSH